VPRKKKPVEKKVIKQKPRHPRPDKDIHWRERREEKPSYKRKRKQEKEIDKDLLSERPDFPTTDFHLTTSALLL